MIMINKLIKKVIKDMMNVAIFRKNSNQMMFSMGTKLFYKEAGLIYKVAKLSKMIRLLIIPIESRLE